LARDGLGNGEALLRSSARFDGLHIVRHGVSAMCHCTKPSLDDVRSEKGGATHENAPNRRGGSHSHSHYGRCVTGV